MRGGNARREHGIDKKSVHSLGVFKTRLPPPKKKPSNLYVMCIEEDRNRPCVLAWGPAGQPRLVSG